jgi:hypothetical protein
MVWGCVSYNGVGRLYRIDNTLTGPGYCTILESALLPSLSDLGYTRQSCIFQQDNDPKHTSNVARKWFAYHSTVDFRPSVQAFRCVTQVFKRDVFKSRGRGPAGVTPSVHPDFKGDFIALSML